MDLEHFVRLLDDRTLNTIRLFTAEICMLGVPRLETSDFGHFDLIHRSLGNIFIQLRILGIFLPT